MILIVDEFDNAHQATELDDEVIKAISDGEYMAFRFDKESGKIQRYNESDWSDIEKWPGTRKA